MSFTTSSFSPVAGESSESLETREAWTNDKIIDQLAIWCSESNFSSVKQQAKQLLSKYNYDIETVPLEILVLSLRTQFRQDALVNFYSLFPGSNFYSLYRDVIHYYQSTVSAPIYFEMLRVIFNVSMTSDFIRNTIEFIHLPIPLSKRDETVVEKTIVDDMNEIRTVIDEDEKSQVQNKNDLMSGPGINAMLAYLTNKLDESSDFSERPPYIREFDIDIEKLPSLKPKAINSYMSPEEMADALIDFTNLLPEEFAIEINNIVRENYASEDEYETAKREFMKSSLVAKLRKFTFNQLSEIANKFQVSPQEIEKIQDDIDLYRVFGPVNAYIDTDYTELVITDSDGEEIPDEDKIYGGARMFLDTRMEYDENDEIKLDDWFTGSCFQCHDRIQHKHYAVRRPLLKGGWIGCFCSWDCVRNFTEDNFLYENGSGESDSDEDNEEENDDNEEEDGKLKKMNSNLRNLLQTEIKFIDNFEVQMNRVGIADREDSSEEREEEEFHVDPHEVAELARNLDKTLGYNLQFDLPELDSDVFTTPAEVEKEDEESEEGYED